MSLVYKKIEMKERLRINVSGIRGDVPGALNVDVASKFASAFASTVEKGRIALCRDSRRTSPMFFLRKDREATMLLHLS